jgi:hypothetical protein
VGFVPESVVSGGLCCGAYREFLAGSKLTACAAQGVDSFGLLETFVTRRRRVTVCDLQYRRRWKGFCRCVALVEREEQFQVLWDRTTRRRNQRRPNVRKVVILMIMHVNHLRLTYLHGAGRSTWFMYLPGRQMYT